MKNRQKHLKNSSFWFTPANQNLQQPGIKSIDASLHKNLLLRTILYHMNVGVVLTLTLICVCSCAESGRQSVDSYSQPTDTSLAEQYSQFLTLRERESANKTYEHLGKHLRTLDFVVLDSTFKSAGGVRKWINLERPGPDLLKLQSSDSVVFDNGLFTLILDYPLSGEFKFHIKCDSTLTRSEFVTLVSEKYHELYRMEELTAKIKTIPINERVGIYNRNVTDGKFGIWGHDLSDLVLSEAHIYKDSRGQYIISLIIQS